MAGIGRAPAAWKAAVLPLNYTRERAVSGPVETLTASGPGAAVLSAGSPRGVSSDRSEDRPLVSVSHSSAGVASVASSAPVVSGTDHEAVRPQPGELQRAPLRAASLETAPARTRRAVCGPRTWSVLS